MSTAIFESGNALERPRPKSETGIPGHPAVIQTTLYDLMAAIHDSVEPDDDDLAIATVAYLLQSGRLTFHGDPNDLASWN